MFLMSKGDNKDASFILMISITSPLIKRI